MSRGGGHGCHRRLGRPATERANETRFRGRLGRPATEPATEAGFGGPFGRQATEPIDEPPGRGEARLDGHRFPGAQPTPASRRSTSIDAVGHRTNSRREPRRWTMLAATRRSHDPDRLDDRAGPDQELLPCARSNSVQPRPAGRRRSLARSPAPPPSSSARAAPLAQSDCPSPLANPPARSRPSSRARR